MNLRQVGLEFEKFCPQHFLGARARESKLLGGRAEV